MALVNDYFKKTDDWQKEYGANTVVFMQVGAFFEVYGIEEKDGHYSGSRLEDFTNICDLKIANKVGNTKMAGFRDLQLDKYLKRMNDEGWTVVVYTQDIQAKNTTRSLEGIYTPGTFFNDDTVVMSNNSMCIWLEKYPFNARIKRLAGRTSIGISLIDIYTGRTYIVNYETDDRHNPSSYDELERCVSIYNPSEVLLISSFDEKHNNEIIQFAGINRNIVKFITPSDKTNLSQKAKKATEQKYQTATLQRFYPSLTDIDSTLYTFSENLHAFQAFTFLLNYIYDHNPNLASKIQMPESISRPSRLILANHSLKQLNMIGCNEKNQSKLSSVSSLLNACITASGRRTFMNVLLNPSSDPNELKLHYNITSIALQTEIWNPIRNVLKDIRDIEKLSRKLILDRFTPKDLVMLYESFKAVISLINIIKTNKESEKFEQYLLKLGVIEDNPSMITSFIEERINCEEAINVDSLQFGSYCADCANKGTCFIKTGFYEDLDIATLGGIQWREMIESIRLYLQDLICKTETKAKAKTDVIKLHETPTMSPTLLLTKRRAAILKCELSKCKDKTITLTTESEIPFEFDISKIQISDASSKSDNIITSPQIIDYLENMKNSKNILTDKLKSSYGKLCYELQGFTDLIKNVADYVRHLDLLQTRCYIAIKYDYCQPVICESEHSYVKTKGLRHPLIEHIQTNEIYVTNDLSLDSNGILLYGTNAVGKTSLIKAIGIAVIMAQAGLYVPCKTFEFYPYGSIFTRILGNDNIHRGLSTFAVEMIELRTILKMADKNSLILGDELCSGTESDSALSIFAAGIERLHNVGCSFIFATHFHEIADYEEVLCLDRVSMKHMTVEYNRELDTLVYDRKLKDGPGDRMYGLEVCKSLDLPSDFLERAHQLRNKYNKTYSSLLEDKTSHFNRTKLMGRCELCDKEGKEVHHLQHQKFANTDNRIKHFHKNHVANLITLCEECHDKFHKVETQFERKKTISGYQLVPIK